MLDAADGPADAVGVHRADLDEAEAQVIQVVIEFAVDVQAGAEADGVVEVDAEDFALQAGGAVVVDPAADQAAARNSFDQLEVPECRPGGLFDVRVADKRSEQYAIQSHTLQIYTFYLGIVPPGGLDLRLGFHPRFPLRGNRIRRHESCCG